MSNATERPTKGAATPDPKVLDTAQVLLVTTPAFPRMRGHPEFHNWAADLVGFGQRDELRPLAEVLGQVASNALIGHAETGSLGPLIEILRKAGSAVDLPTLVQGSIMAEKTASDSPCASFILAWVTLCIWIVGAPARREYLYGEEAPWPGWPHPGWAYIPAACVATAIKLQGLYGSALLTREAYEVLEASRRRHWERGSRLEPAISKYRQLGKTIATRYDMAIANLADDLSEAWGVGRTRYIVAALLWSLGLVPECNAFRVNADPPGRALFRRLIQRSLECLPNDPLIQYVWLELKDDMGDALRAHEALFAVINHNWNQWWLDSQYPALLLNAEPSRLYAQTLVALLAGDLDESRAAQYLYAYDLIFDGRLDLPPAAFILHRLDMLRHLIGERFNYYGPDFTEETRVEFLKEKTEAAGRRREQVGRFPELPDALARLSLSTFELIEHCLKEDTGLGWSEDQRCVTVLDTLERFRIGALAYWLTVNPPLRPAADNGEVKNLFQEESNLIEQLRGAYYVALRPALPLHYEWADMDLDVSLSLRDPARREWFYSPDVARQEMQEIEFALTKIAQRLQSHAPEYATRRLAPPADLNRLVAALSRHAQSSATS